MSKIKIAIPSDAVANFVTEMSIFNPVVNNEDIAKNEEIIQVEFDLVEVNQLFLVKVFFAGMTHGIKSMRKRLDTVIETQKNNIL